MTKLEGNIKKMQAENKAPIQYSMVLSDQIIPVNEHIGSTIALKWSGIIHCVKCGNKTNKSFFQGFCYPCFINAPESSECILRPELCQAHEGISRDMEWSKRHCLSDHYVYLSLTSGVKVGVTRHTQIPTRWIDQGAVEGLVIAETPYRQAAGLIEIALKKYISDRTNWRKMLQNELSNDDLRVKRDELTEFVPVDLKEYLVETEPIAIKFPVISHPVKVKSMVLDKVPIIEMKLIGIKGQYLLFDDGYVINIRRHSGYYISLEI